MNTEAISEYSEFTSDATREDTVLTRFFEIREVPHVGGGDADVWTKRNRHTHVSVATDNLTIDPGGEAVRLTVVYSVKEGARNNTHLEWAGEVQIDAPRDYKIVKAGAGRSDVSFGKTYHGKDHEWHDETAQVEGSYFANLQVKFDGPGADNKGNARMKAIIAIPVTLEK